jgi:hypothetical protein
VLPHVHSKGLHPNTAAFLSPLGKLKPGEKVNTGLVGNFKNSSHALGVSSATSGRLSFTWEGCVVFEMLFLLSLLLAGFFFFNIKEVFPVRLESTLWNKCGFSQNQPVGG